MTNQDTRDIFGGDDIIRACMNWDVRFFDHARYIYIYMWDKDDPQQSLVSPSTIHD